MTEGMSTGYMELEATCKALAATLETALAANKGVAEAYAALVEKDAALRQLWRRESQRAVVLWRAGWIGVMRRAKERLAQEHGERALPCGPVTKDGHDPFASHTALPNEPAPTTGSVRAAARRRREMAFGGSSR